MRRPNPLLVALACAPLTLACGGDEPPPQEVVRPVKLVTFGDGGGDRVFSYPGRVFPNTTVEVAFEVTGKLQELPVAKGEEVQRGELLARLDQRDFRNDLAAARAAAEEAEATANRYREAAEKRAVSQRELDEAEARARIAVADLKIAEKALEDTVIRADFDGIVANRYVENFQQIEAKQPIMSFQEISVLEIRVDVPERDIGGEVADDEQLKAVFDVAPGREFELEIKEFVTQADPVTQTFPVTLRLESPKDVEILPGMTATVHYYPGAQAGRAATTLPSVAVLGQQGREPWVWVVDRDAMTVSKRTVQVGEILAGDQIRVVSGLQRGERVAAAGAHHLAEGMRVREYRR